jgi:serine/threonine protein kinase
LKEKLGSGGHGDVFKVEKLSTKKEMVMKVIRLGDEGEKNSKAIRAELEVGMKLGSLSKFLVQLTEFFIENSCCCLIMEYCNNGDLEKILREKKRIPQKVRNNYY